MKNQPVQLLPLVEGDLRYGRAYYDSWLTDGGLQFHEKFRETLAWIEWNPEMFPRKYRGFRRVVIRRTYFGVYFAIEAEVTTVIAVVDLRQNPKTIRQLLIERI